MGHSHKGFFVVVISSYTLSHSEGTSQEVDFTSLQHRVSFLIAEDLPQGIRERQLEINRDALDIVKIKSRDIMGHDVEQLTEALVVVAGCFAIEANPGPNDIWRMEGLLSSSMLVTTEKTLTSIELFNVGDNIHEVKYFPPSRASR